VAFCEIEEYPRKVLAKHWPGVPIYAEDARQPSWGERFNARGMEIWSLEPNVGRVANGGSARVDRLKGLGNAVVPQIPELIGRAILETDLQ
jgi:hypothetical protein